MDNNEELIFCKFCKWCNKHWYLTETEIQCLHPDSITGYNPITGKPIRGFCFYINCHCNCKNYEPKK